MSGVDAVGIDEKYVGRGRVVTVVHDGSEATGGRVLHVSEGRKAENVAAFAQALREHGGDPDNIERCTMDMANSFIAGVRDHLPNAQACFDPFHLVKLANEALDQVRREEVASEPALKHTRYHWLKDASDWTAKEVNLHWLRHSGLKTARAWRLKECLRDILAWRRFEPVPVLLLMDGWISWASRCRLQPFKRLAQTFKTHLEGIRHMLTHANSNASAESINADIQSAISRARGFRTFRNLRTILYLLKGKLTLPCSPYRPALA
jgi:transposase